MFLTGLLELGRAEINAFLLTFDRPIVHVFGDGFDARCHLAFGFGLLGRCGAVRSPSTSG